MGLIQSIAQFFVGEKETVQVQRPGRNEDCWCGSGKKYKKCHLDEDERKQRARHKANCGTH